MLFAPMRHATTDPHARTAAAVSGGGPRLLLSFGVVAAIVLGGFWTFTRQSF